MIFKLWQYEFVLLQFYRVRSVELERFMIIKPEIIELIEKIF